MPNTLGHHGGRPLYQTLRKENFLPALAMDSYSIVCACTACACESVKLRRNSTLMKLYPATEPLYFFSIEILGAFIRTKSLNFFHVVITARFTKLTITVPLKRITATAVLHAFLFSLVFTYCSPRVIKSDNGSQFMSCFFTDVC